MSRYPATYSDTHGTEATAIENDGEFLRMSVRGVTFVGRDFDILEPTKDAAPDQLRRFSLNQGDLCSCRIECRIPVPVESRGKLSDGALLVEVVLGDPMPKGNLTSEQLRIALEYDGARFIGSGRSGWFEDELLEIQAQLPDGVFIKACINCLYSDYSPGGHGLFGDMRCFRNLKADYLKVTTKKEFWPVLARCDVRMQETYLCPEFERRVPGTGYRG